MMPALEVGPARQRNIGVAAGTTGAGIDAF
jgi:hypothetical protein